ncbi:MAG: serine/threonine-protein kinase [Myxococcota bacterium]
MRGSETQRGAEVTLADSAPLTGEASSPFERGATLGRYVVLETLGSGGMGVVLAAYDSKLDRRVALKLLHPRTSQDADGHARLLREAQALAKLSHPAVVSVYDVGAMREQVFIAMEFIDGPNLRGWVHAERRTPAQVLAVFRDAARGLIAAHDAGIVHRDFKPDNVLIGTDGRARVTDFGLAVPKHAPVPVVAASSSSSHGSMSGRLTETGMVMGTPAYMPLEQHAGRLTDERSDQFSFCVSLYEALYGVRPFTGATGAELCAAIKQQSVPPAPSGTTVPRFVHEAIVRGLAARPNDRHPSMRALLRALRPRSRRGRTWMQTSVAGLVLGTAALTVAEPSERPCSIFTGRAAALFPAERAAAVRDAFLATDLPNAAPSFEAVSRDLDAFSDRWATTAHEACLATERGEQSDHMHDLRMHCLERARAQVDATIDVLGTADDTVIARSLEMVAKQTNISVCSDTEALQRTSVLPRDADEAARAAAAFDVLDRVEVLRMAGRKDEAKTLLTEHVDALEASTYPPTAAGLAWHRGRIAGGDNRADEAIEHFERAYTLALEHGLLRIAAQAASSIAFYYSEFKVDLERADDYIRAAIALARASGSKRTESAALGNLVTLRVRASRFDEALQAAEDSLRLAQEDDAHPILIGHAMVTKAQMVARVHGPKAARVLLLEAETLIIDAVGPQHGHLVGVYNGLYDTARKLDEHQTALRYANASLHQAQAAHGTDSLDEAYALANVATALGKLGRVQEALTMLARVDETFAREYGKDHPIRSTTLNNLASLQVRLEAWPSAYALFGEARDIQAATADGPSEVLMLLDRNLAEVSILMGDLEGAAAHAESAMRAAQALYGNDHSVTGEVLTTQGRIALEQGDYAAARTALERAVSIGNDTPSEFAITEFLFARVLLESPGSTPADCARARAMARACESVFAHAAGRDDMLDEVRAWLQAHDG